MTAGYEQGRAEICNVDAVYNEAHGIGAVANASPGLPPRYRICPDAAGLARSFDAGYAAGITSFCQAQLDVAYRGALAQGQAGTIAPTYRWPPACTEEQRTQLDAQVKRGYREGLVAYCAAANLEVAGLSDGKAGRPAANPTSATFAACDLRQQKRIAQSYTSAYRAGLASFCAAEDLDAQAAADASAGRTQADVAKRYAVCSVKQRKKHAQRYQRAYVAALAKACHPDGMEAQGTRDGEAGRAGTDIAARFPMCDAKARARIQERYATAYESGLVKYCDPDRVAAAASKAALDGAVAPKMPAHFDVCVGRFPALKKHFETEFARGREQHVANACTFEAGVNAGRADASRTNQRTLAMPAYCDRATFERYQQGYLDGWHRTKAALCSEIQASQQGVSDAQANRPLRYQAPPLCPAELHASLLAAYTAGHRSVPPPPQSPPAATLPASTSTTTAPPAQITWTTNASANRGKLGARIEMYCPAMSSLHRVWGTDVYSDDSSICSAAVHAGVIDTSGGRIVIEIRPGLGSYRGSSRHGVQSRDYGWFAGSFTFPEARPVASEDALEAARRVCMERGFAPSACRDVTSIVCLQKGYAPSACNLPTTHLPAVEACLVAGYYPSSCASVTDVACIKMGHQPSSCALAPSTARTPPADSRPPPSPRTPPADSRPPSSPPAAHDGEDDHDDHDARQRRFESCVTWADGQYRRSLSYADARDRANTNCRRVRDLEVAKYVFSVASRSLGYADATDLALDGGRRRLERKLPELKYATENYQRSLGYADAVKRAIAGVEKVRRDSRSCLQSNFQAYSRSLGYADAMDRSIAQCQ